MRRERSSASSRTCFRGWGVCPLARSRHRSCFRPRDESKRAVRSKLRIACCRPAVKCSDTRSRPGELRKAEWSEFDLDAAVWRIPAARMKHTKQEKLSGAPHVVPLSRQALAVVRELQPLTGHGRYVFPSPRTGERPMSDNGVLSALRRMGFPSDEMTGHGFRAMARTLLAERLNVDEAVIEAQLAHAVKDSLGRAYNRTEFLEQRRKMLQSWADYLD